MKKEDARALGTAVGRMLYTPHHTTQQASGGLGDALNARCCLRLVEYKSTDGIPDPLSCSQATIVDAYNPRPGMGNYAALGTANHTLHAYIYLMYVKPHVVSRK